MDTGELVLVCDHLVLSGALALLASPSGEGSLTAHLQWLTSSIQGYPDKKLPQGSPEESKEKVLLREMNKAHLLIDTRLKGTKCNPLTVLGS